MLGFDSFLGPKLSCEVGLILLLLTVIVLPDIVLPVGVGVGEGVVVSVVDVLVALMMTLLVEGLSGDAETA